MARLKHYILLLQSSQTLNIVLTRFGRKIHSYTPGLHAPNVKFSKIRPQKSWRRAFENARKNQPDPRKDLEARIVQISPKSTERYSKPTLLNDAN